MSVTRTPTESICEPHDGKIVSEVIHGYICPIERKELANLPEEISLIWNSVRVGANGLGQWNGLSKIGIFCQDAIRDAIYMNRLKIVTCWECILDITDHYRADMMTFYVMVECPVLVK